MKDFIDNGENFVSVDKDTPLPWWLVR